MKNRFVQLVLLFFIPVALSIAKDENMKIELVYLEGCPNMEPAKRELQAALKIMEMDTGFVVWESSDPKAPEYADKYGSPTILLNGKDIFGDDLSPNPACRLYGSRGYPVADQIIEHLNAKQKRQ